MFRHKFLWLTLIVGLFVFSGCSSSDSDDEVVIPPDANNSSCDAGEHFDEVKNSCVLDTPPKPICTDEQHFDEVTNSCVSNDVVAKTLKSLYISGRAIDGYIDGADVKIGDIQVKSDKQGKWSFELKNLDEDYTPSSVVTVSGGIDTATGKAFEGILSNIVEIDDFAKVTFEEGTEEKKFTPKPPVVVTPLTTIVVHTVKAQKKSGVTISKAEAQEKVAKALGLSTATLDSDPIAILESDNDSEEAQDKRLEAAKAVKKAFVIQKLSESLSKSVVDANDTTEGATKFEDVFSAVLSTVAEKLQEGNGTVVDFQEVLENDADAFAQSVTANIQEAEDIKEDNTDLTDTELLEKKRAKAEKFAERLIKLQAATAITTKVVTVINNITDSDINQLDVISKATEIITQKLEAKIEEIAKIEIEISDELISKLIEAQDNKKSIVISDKDIDTTALDKAEQEAKQVANAVIAMGGIEAIAEQIQIVVEKAKENSDENVTVETTFDIDSFGDLLSDDIITENALIFDSFEALGISADAIIKATNEANDSQSVFDLAVENQNEIAETEGTEKVDATAVEDARIEIEKQISDAQENFETQADETAAQIEFIPICGDNQYLEDGVCVDKVTEVVCEDGYSLNADENICVLDNTPDCSENQHEEDGVCVDDTTVVTPATCDAGYYLDTSTNSCVYNPPVTDTTKTLEIINLIHC